MKRFARGLVAGPVVLLTCVLGSPAGAAASQENATSADVDCAVAGASISEVQGPVGAGHDNVIIQVRNLPFEPCVLPAYPTVDLFDVATGSFMEPTESPRGPLGAGAAPTTTLSPVTLPPGAVASALLGGTDFPLDGAPTCPAFSYTVSLPGSSLPAHFDGPLADCSGFELGPFILGFNGASPTGEVTGTAPSCAPRAGASIGPESVKVEAWHGDKLAGLFQAFTGTSSRHYQMVLRPGRYRITSGNLQPRHIVVQTGLIRSIGRFGACRSVPSNTLRTVPPKYRSRGPTTTTSTTRRTPATSAAGRGIGVPRGASMAPCANDQLRISALRYGAAAGAVSQVIEFRDIGSEPCSLTGYPGVAALDSQGLQVEQARRQLNATMGGQFEGTQPQTVPLEPGGLATATVQGSDVPVGLAPACPTYFPSFLVTAPGGTQAVVLSSVGARGPGFAEQGFPGCSPLIVTPVVPGTIGSPPETPATP